MSKFKTFIIHHKALSVFLLLIVFGGVFLIYRSLNKGKSEIRYVLASVEKGTIISSISGSGQVSVSNQVDLKPKASGEVVYVGVKEGQEVKQGLLLVQLDSREAQKAVRDAQANLASAKLSFQKLQQPPDSLTLLQMEHSLAQAQESKQKAGVDLAKAYEDGFNAISNAFLDLPNIITGLFDILYGTTSVGGNPQWYLNYYADAVKEYDNRVLVYQGETSNSYKTARAAYDKNFEDYRTLSRFSENSLIESSLNQTYETTKLIAESVKSANNFIQFYKDKLTERGLKTNTIADTHLSLLNAYTGDTNGHLSSLLSILRTIQTSKETIVNSDRSIAEKTESLAKLKAGADPLDIESQKLSVRQKENALTDAREKLSDYFIRAPFDGIIAQLNVKKGDSASSGSAVATLITKQRIAGVSLNEVDVAKVKVGQKATLTFDAIEGLSISGEVVEIDTIGTVTQGVVTYNVKIGFDTQDDRIKPGMSVSASIITEIKQDVLVVPNSAVKTQGSTQYVEIFDQVLSQNQGNQGVLSSDLPRQQPVETGLSNDTSSEIVSGLVEGEQVVTQAITANTAQSQSQQNSSVRIPGITGGGGGFPRGGMLMR